jgi:hypothetical protein
VTPRQAVVCGAFFAAARARWNQDMTRALLTAANVMTRPACVDAMRCRPMRQPLACWTLHGRHEGPPICVLASHPNRERARTRRTLFFVSPCCVARLSALHRSCAEPATNSGRAARATSAGAVNNAPQGHVEHAAEPWSRAHAKWSASSRPSQRSAPPTVRARTGDRPTVVGSMGEAIDDRSLHRDAYSGRYVSGRTQR